MAEELLVKEPLSEGMLRAGAELTLQLDANDWPVVASFWFFDPDNNRWRLYIASPKVKVDGPLKSYQRIREVLDSLKLGSINLNNIAVLKPDHPLVQTLAGTIVVPTTEKPVRFSQEVVNRRFIDDAYVYRVPSMSSAA